MAATTRVPLGAPGIYPYPDVPLRTLSNVRMDVCAFVGIAPRGPARVPVINETWRDDRPCVEPERPRRRSVAVAVESFDEYRRIFGGFEGPGRLPYAVASFFEQGGLRAYVARIVHRYDNPADDAAAVAAAELPDLHTSAALPLLLRARGEGGWGNRLRASWACAKHPVGFEAPLEMEDPINAGQVLVTGLVLGPRSELSLGSAVLLHTRDGEGELRFLTAMARVGRPNTPGFAVHAVLDQAVSVAEDARPDAPPTIENIEVVEGVLTLDLGGGIAERHEGLGLSSGHPRWIAQVLCYESELVYPDAGWADSEIDLSSLDIEAASASPSDRPWVDFDGGKDRYADITPDDFFDFSWTPNSEEPGSGVHALAQLPDLALLAVPDLYSPAPLTETESIDDPVSLAGPAFERCVDLPPEAPKAEDSTEELEGLRLDPKQAQDLEKITRHQRRLVDFADATRCLTALLDVPPGLTQRQIITWRSAFDSSYAAAYHPWLKVSRRDDSRDVLIRVPPSAAAAGIIARREVYFGVQHGPANVIADQTLEVDEPVSAARHDQLHPLGINVYLPEREGVRLSAGRTLSLDPAYRQLSVRRLMTMIRKALDRRMQWVVFEPNNSLLRGEVRRVIRTFLGRLFQAGAFRGAVEEEAFFVRCDEDLNPPRVVDAGRLVAHVGVAPAEPLEFILLRMSREGDGTLSLEE